MDSYNLSNITYKNDTDSLYFYQKCNFSVPAICKQILLITSIILSCLTLIVVVKSKKHLIKVEFGILLYLSFILIFVKIKLFIQNKQFNSDKSHSNKFQCILYYVFDNLVPHYYFLLLYYSIFHLTIWFGKKIRELITNVNFFIFFSISSTLLGIINTLLIISIKYDSFLFDFKFCAIDANQFYSIKILLINLIYIIPAMLTTLIYCFLNFFLLKNIICMKKSPIKLHSDFKNFRIVFLFSIFSLVSNVNSLVWLNEIIQIYFENKISFFLHCALIELMYFSDFFTSIIVLFCHRKLQTIQIIKNLAHFFGKKLNKLKIQSN